MSCGMAAPVAVLAKSAVELHILISPMGAKSYRSMFYFSGSARGYTRHLGRVGECVDEARQLCRDDRRNARKGIDPRADSPLKSDSYKSAVDDYVDRVQIGEHHNVAAEKARQVLVADCKDWLARPIATIRNTKIERLLERQLRDGNAKLRRRCAEVPWGRNRAMHIGSVRSVAVFTLGRPLRRSVSPQLYQ